MLMIPDTALSPNHQLLVSLGSEKTLHCRNHINCVICYDIGSLQLSSVLVADVLKIVQRILHRERALHFIDVNSSDTQSVQL